MAAPTYISRSNGSASSSSLTVQMPTSFAAGDMLIMVIETANEAVPSPPSGWTEFSFSPVGTGTAGGTLAVRLTAYYKIADGTETAIDVGDSGNHNVGYTIAIRSSTGSYAINTANTATVGSSSLNVNMPLVTTTVNDCLVLLLYAWGADRSTIAFTTGWFDTNLTSQSGIYNYGTTLGNGGGIFSYYGILSTAGDAGTGGYTATGTFSSSTQALATIAINEVTSTSNPPIIIFAGI